jgi:homeobox protein cut-like
MNAAINSALELWKKAQLQELQKQLDQQSLEIVDQQQKSLESRKRLANQTKEFKKMYPEINEAIKPLLKEYQMEIDSSAKRSKLVESWFLGVYKVLVDVPDPEPLLTNCLTELKRLDEIEVYAKENQALRDQVASLTLQIIPTSEIDGYKSKIAYFESMLETLVMEKVAEITQELKDEFEQKLSIQKETEVSLHKQIIHLKNEYMSLQSQQEFTLATQVQTQTHGDNHENKTAELEVCILEIENLNAKCFALQKENVFLKQQNLESLQKAPEAPDLSDYVKELEKELNDRKQEYQTLEGRLIQKSKESDFQLAQIEAKAAAMVLEMEELKLKLEQMKDYDMLKQELDVLKSFEGTDTSQTLEQMLLDKNKRLENELVLLKRDNQEVSYVLDQTMQKNQELLQQVAEKAHLVSKLEQDLQKIGRSQPNNVIESLVVKKEDGIVPILTAQRDRYKLRFEETQERLNQITSRLQTMEYEISRLREDNVSLYEKLRYQETYAQKVHAS